MSAGDYITGPRCGEPVTYYRKPGRGYSSAGCWRPAGHPGGKHLSQWAYLRELERKARTRRASRHLWRPA
jgi:hypothetical protein